MQLESIDIVANKDFNRTQSDIPVLRQSGSFESQGWPQSWKSCCSVRCLQQLNKNGSQEIILDQESTKEFFNDIERPLLSSHKSLDNSQQQSKYLNIQNIHQQDNSEKQANVLSGIKEAKDKQSKQSMEEVTDSISQGSFTIGEKVIDQDEGTEYGRTLMNGVNSLAGIGLLTTPYMVAQGGQVSLIILFIVGILCYYTGTLLKQCQQARQGINTYPDIGQYAYGRIGRIIISVFLYIELFATSIELVILESKSIQSILPSLFDFEDKLPVQLNKNQIYIILSGLLFLPTIYIRNLKVLAIISASGVIVMLLIALCVLGQTVQYRSFFNKDAPFVIYSGIPVAFGISGFCYGGHPIFPTIYQNMKDKSLYSMLLKQVFILVYILYAVVAYFGYSLYGPDVSDSLADSMMKLHPRSPFSIISFVVVAIIPISKYALVLSPVLYSLEEFLDRKSQKTFRLSSFLIRSSVVASTVIIAIVVPYFGYFMQFIGSLLSVSVSIIFPSFFYILIFNQSSMLKKCSVVFTALIGFIIAFFGTYSSIAKMYKPD